MRVGIITVHNGKNYGASLQAFALVQALQNHGVEAYLIDYRTEKIEERMRSYDQFRSWNSLINVKCNIRYILSNILFKTQEHSEKVKTKFSDFHKLITDTESGVFYHCNELTVLNDKYDAFICGSDQIWNKEITNLDGAFFLEFAGESKIRIAYAPSLGMPSDMIDKNIADDLKKKLFHIQYLSIREENNRHLIEILTGRSCITVMDPVLLIGRNDWEKLLDISDEVCPDVPYAFYYPVIEQPELEKFAMKESKKRGWKLMNPRLVPQYAKVKGFNAFPAGIIGPAEFLKLLVHSEAVFTNSFHATVFSTIFQKELFVHPLNGEHSNRNNRLYEYLKMMKLLGTNKNEEYVKIHLKPSYYKNVSKIQEEKKDVFRTFSF